MEDKNEQLEPEIENVEATEIPEIQETEESKIEKLELEVQEWKDSYTRKLAEFQNFSRRKENELAEFKKYASEEIILKVLDNVDNLERAIDSTRA